MKENFEREIEDERQIKQFELDTFPYNRYSILDNPIDKLVEDIKQQISKANSEYNKLVEFEKKDPKRFKELDEIAQRSDFSLDLQMYGYIEKVRYLEEELYAVFEMKIIYAFKHLEISIKQLLSIAYDDFSAKRQYQWDSLTQFLSSKNINIKKLKEYNDVNHLRLLNNSLKHSDQITDSNLKTAKEFKGKDYISFIDLEKFYDRVKKMPNKFLSALKNEVLADIYDFSEKRLADLANSFALRMTKENATHFVEHLKKLYR